MKTFIIFIALLILPSKSFGQAGRIYGFSALGVGSLVATYFIKHKREKTRYNSQDIFQGTYNYDNKTMASDSIKLTKGFLIPKNKTDSVNLSKNKFKSFSLSSNGRTYEVERFSYDNELKQKLFDVNGLGIYNNNFSFNIDKNKKQSLLFLYDDKHDSRNFYINGKDNKLISHFLSKRFGMKDDMIAAVLQKLNNL